MCHLRDNVEKYGTARQVTDDHKIRRMRIACGVIKATKTHSGCLIWLFHCNSGSANASYVCKYLPGLLALVLNEGE